MSIDMYSFQDSDLYHAPASLRLYKDIIAKQNRKLYCKFVKLLIKSQCEISSSHIEVAKLSDTMDSTLTSQQRKKEKSRDALNEGDGGEYNQSRLFQRVDITNK